jgi:ribosome-binding protein aMBF1 (putative translation factor)
MESINTLADMTESPLEAPEVLRRRLKDALRKARENADLTQKAVAQQLDWSPSKIIRIEQGAVGVSSTDVRALLRLYGVDDESQVRELTELAKRSRKQSWSEYKDVYSQVSLTLFAYESAAKRS